MRNQFGRRASWLLAGCLCWLWPGAERAGGQGNGGSDVPTSAVAFFAPDVHGCPPGWRVATEASGRVIVGVTSGDSVGRQVGLSLANEEDRTHQHSFATAVTLPYKSISALDGGNDQGAAAQMYTDGGVGQAVASGLPFIQLVACVKQ